MKYNRIMSFLLAVLLLFSMTNLPTYAEEAEADDSASMTEEMPCETQDEFSDPWNEPGKEYESTNTNEAPTDTSDQGIDADDTDVDDLSDTADVETEPSDGDQPAENQADDAAWPEPAEEETGLPDDVPEEETQMEDDSFSDENTGEDETSDVVFEEESENETLQEDAWEETDDLIPVQDTRTLIQLAIDTVGYAYVKTKDAITIYRDGRLRDVLCVLPNAGEVLLGTDYDLDAGSIAVCIVTPKIDVLEGYVRESNLSKDVVTMDEVDRLAVDRDYVLLQLRDETLPVFISAVWFQEQETAEMASENDDGAADSAEEYARAHEAEDTDDGAYIYDDSEEETVPADEAPMMLTATRAGSYTLYAESTPPITISTRPRALLTGNRYGFYAISGGLDDGQLSSIYQTYNMKNQYVTVLGFARYHHVLIQCEWYDSSMSVTRTLLAEAAYMHPVEKTYTQTIRDPQGNVYPNYEVTVQDGKGNYVTTVTTDANGVASYTGLHLNVSAMLSFAEANYEEVYPNTLIEDNDCATFVSECLTAGGFCVYGAYASNSDATPGQYSYGLYDRLVSWIGVTGTEYPSVYELSPGDTVFLHPQNKTGKPYGHSMIIGDVNYATGQVLVYGHSSANKQTGDTNKMWISVDRICYAAFTSIYQYSFEATFPEPTPTPVPTPEPTPVPTPEPTPEPTPTPAPAKGQIRIRKKDSLNGIGLAGVVFDIYLGDTWIDSMTTDESGTAVSVELPEGSYTVRERELPEGYTGDLAVLECEVKSGEITELLAENQPIQFRIKIVKTDAMTQEPLAGADFTIVNTDDGQTVEVLTTDDNGEAISGLLRWGKYEVTETKVPDGYVDSGFSVTVHGEENGKTYEIHVENQPMFGGIRITKSDRLDGTPIAGVVFDIFQGSTFVSSITTDASGIALSGELPKGSYTVKERALPDGYTGDLVSLDCVVKSNEVTDLTAENQPIQFQVKIVKTDAQTQALLAGAEFTITRKDTGTVAATLTTDDNGEAISGLLRYGEYTVKETKTPAHYAESAFSTVISGTEHEKVYEIRVENEPTQGQIRLMKTDALDGQPISGVVFDIYQGNTLIGSMETDDNGLAVSDPLPKGDYTVKEHEHPEGYVSDLVSLDCSVQSDEVTELTAENTPIQLKIKIVKTDALTQEPLSGAEFTVKRISGLPSHNGAGDEEIVAVLVTGENGEAATDLLTWGQYEVTETKTPENYVDHQYTEIVTGTENEKAYILQVENEPMKGWIRLEKTDWLNGQPIEGVTFDILLDGRIVSAMTTDAEGAAMSEPLPKGIYTVKEHANPTGYTHELFSADCEVFSDTVTRLTAVNQPIQGRIRIVKKDALTKTPLTGAEFTITRVSGIPSQHGEGNGDVVAVLTTDASGTAVSPLLTWGTYRVDETKVPDHYVDESFSALVVIQEDEKTYEITAENEPTQGWIELIKTDALDRTPIAGVQFDIYENDEYGSGLAATMTTDENGVAKSPALRKGKYLVKEHENPTGYVSDLAKVECTVKSDEITHISATNQPIQGKIRIVKTDELTMEALAGAEFTITRVFGLPSHNGSSDGEVAAVITTDADGVAVTPLLTWGVYRVEESGVPVHYVDNAFSTEVTIQEENLVTVEVAVENEPAKGWIRLTKTDRKNGNPISGVQFDIYFNDQYGEGLAATMTTGEDGVALSEPLRKGKYIVKEHGETAGYLFEEVTLECTVKPDEVTDLTADNQPVMIRLLLYKRDMDEYQPQTKKSSVEETGTRGDGVLTGAVFQVRAGEDITDRQGNILYEKDAVVVENLKTCGEEASVLTDELWPGVYEIVEVTPPTGFQLDETPVRVDTTSAALQSTEAVVTFTAVKTNEILYGRYAFVKFYGDNQVHDDAGLIENPESGAVFQVYLKSAGSYEAARKFERDTITTDKNGKAQTKLLPYGIYTVEQVKGKQGYAIKAPFDIFIRGTEDPDDPPTMIINNEAIHYRLKFIKIDAETGNTITAVHTSFKLKDSEGNYVTQTVYYPHKEEIDTFTTDETGEVTLPETLIYGLYFAEEFEAPEGYLIATQEIPVFVGDDHLNQPGEAYLLEYRVENEPVKGRILLEKKGPRLTGFEEKTDSFGNTYFQPVYEEKYLAGAVFEIHAAEDVIGKDGTLWYHADDLVETITTTAEGKDASQLLPLGKYYLIEVSAPEGYIITGGRYEARLEYADDHTTLVEITVEAHNDYLPVSVSLEKEMEIMEIVQGADHTVRQIVSAAPGQGFVFGLFNEKDIQYDGGTLLADTLVATGATDADGHLTFSGVYPHGSYYIKELSKLDGWRLNPNAFPVDLSANNQGSDNMIRASLPETVKNDLIYTHVTLTKTDVTGQQTVPGALIEVTDSVGNVIYRAYTDENGEIPDIPVTPGRYTFREILAPAGYELNKAEMSFSVDKDGSVTGDTVIRDDYTRFYLLKLDESGRPLAGVEFGLIQGSGEPLFTAVSDERGVVTFERIPYGTYSVVETCPLPGYFLDKTSVQITLDGTFVNPTLPLATVMNQPNTVWLKKVDQDGQPLAGAEFVLCNEYGERVATAVSDQMGVVRFQRIPYGVYTIREIVAPKGYLLSREVISVTIDQDYQNSDEPFATVMNRLKRLKYIKVDTSGQYLPGVEFALINAATGEEVETVVSNEQGEFIFTAFDYGVWIIREAKAPDGYNPMDDIIVSVDNDWVEPEPFTCVNIPNHYVFRKTDNEGNPMTGVKFTLEDSDENVLRELISTEDGVVFVPGLTPGAYLIREVETLEGFTVASEPIQVVIDEHYTIPDEMPTLINYPTIQTGAGIEMTPLMWIGVGITGAAVLLGIGYAIKRGRSKRHKKH